MVGKVKPGVTAENINIGRKGHLAVLGLWF